MLLKFIQRRVKLGVSLDYPYILPHSTHFFCSHQQNLTYILLYFNHTTHWHKNFLSRPFHLFNFLTTNKKYSALFVFSLATLTYRLIYNVLITMASVRQMKKISRFCPHEMECMTKWNYRQKFFNLIKQCARRRIVQIDTDAAVAWTIYLEWKLLG